MGTPDFGVAGKTLLCNGREALESMRIGWPEPGRTSGTGLSSGNVVTYRHHGEQTTGGSKTLVSGTFIISMHSGLFAYMLAEKVGCMVILR